MAERVISPKHILMAFDKYDFDSLAEERRKSIGESIRSIDVDELKKLGNEIFRNLDDPWRETYLGFIAEHPHCTFHYATTTDGVHIVYCDDKNRGMWFLPGIAKGPLQAKGCQVMKEMSNKAH
jgi:hypothetical protein